MIVFPNCKINLGLQILQKRKDGFHNIETIFYPIALKDALEIIETDSGKTSLITSGINIDITAEENICLKAYNLLKKDFSQLPPVLMHLHKCIPAGAGLGGGSSDAAFTITLLNRKFDLGLSEKDLLKYALQLGSDCPFFIKNTPCLARGRGEILEDINLDLESYKIILVNPQIHISTAKAFSKINPFQERMPLVEIIQKPITEWKHTLQNDFESAVFEWHPQIMELKDLLYQQNAIYASMTGTGSTVYGIFEKDITPELNFPPHYFVKEYN